MPEHEEKQLWHWKTWHGFLFIISIYTFYKGTQMHWKRPHTLYFSHFPFYLIQFPFFQSLFSFYCTRMVPKTFTNCIYIPLIVSPPHIWMSIWIYIYIFRHSFISSIYDIGPSVAFLWKTLTSPFTIPISRIIQMKYMLFK